MVTSVKPADKHVKEIWACPDCDRVTQMYSSASVMTCPDHPEGKYMRKVWPK